MRQVPLHVAPRRPVLIRKQPESESRRSSVADAYSSGPRRKAWSLYGNAIGSGVDTLVVHPTSGASTAVSVSRGGIAGKLRFALRKLRPTIARARLRLS